MNPMHQRGFTVLEMLIASALFMIALMAIGVVFDSNRRSYVRGEIAVDVQQNARLALAEMAREIRMAGFYPENFTIPAASPALVNPVQLATETAVAIYGDIENSGTSEVFLYCLDGTTLRRGSAPQGDTSAYWCPATDVLAENVTGLRFTYFDENNDPIPDPPGASFELDGEDEGSVPDFSDVTQRSAVRRIAIALTVEEPIPGHGTETYEVGSEVLLRNVQ